VLGQHELDEMLAEREKLNSDIHAILDQTTATWCIKVANVEIKHVDLDESMVRAIAAQAEAERTRRAKVINAEGEFQASQRLTEAAKVLASQPQAMQAFARARSGARPANGGRNTSVRCCAVNLGAYTDSAASACCDVESYERTGA
jgi:regulator of protease activity HflC (stomatin/prohibitin superfamily)